jgi:phosphatidylserine/phosphatidylglycerophosphate/cardiolipin synthase-like enzyme
MAFFASAIDRVAPISSGAYHPFVVQKFHAAVWRAWAAIFIIEVRPGADTDLRVRELLSEIERAAWRGVDVRVLLGISDTVDIRLANAVSEAWLQVKKVQVRRYRPTQNKASLHSKYILFDDDLVVIGGHNWSPGAFGKHEQESVAVHSRDINRRLAGEFHTLWENASTTEGVT